MNSSSVARKNRRMRQMQLPSLSNIRTSDTPLPLYTVDSKVEFSEGCKSSDISLNKNESHLNSDYDSMKPKELFRDEGNDTYAATTGCSFINFDVSSRPVGKVFVEDERGFKELDIKQIFQPPNNRDPSQTMLKNELAIDLAYKTARQFHSLCNFSHGLLGGMSFLHVLLLFHIMSSEPLNDDIIKNFSFLSHPIHNVFNFLCIICIISAFDRYDIGNPKELYKQLQKCNLKLIILLIYPLCLLLSLSTANVDEKLCLPDKNSTVLEVFQLKDAEHELSYWKVLSISKCIGAILGWIVIATETDSNSFLDRLRNISQKSNSPPS